MSAARASGMDLASSLKRNTFLTLGVRPMGGGLRGTGGHAGGPEGGHGSATERWDTGGPP